MKIIKLTNIGVLLISLIFLVSLSAPSALGQEKHKTGGTWYGVKTKSESIPVSDGIKGHMLSFVSFKGYGTKLDGSKGVLESQAVAHLIKMNGTNSGYNYLRFEDGSTLVKKFEGKITTKPSEPGKPPLVTFEGTWTIVKGTGKYENAVGSGSYKGRYIGPGIYVNVAEGEYVIKK